MTEPSSPLLLGVAATLVLGTLFDLFTLLLLPYRVGGHLVPVGPALALLCNAVLGWAAMRLLGSRLPAQLLIALVVVLSLVAAGRGPGGDLLVTRDLQTMFMVYAVAAAGGAAIPLFVRRTR